MGKIFAIIQAGKAIIEIAKAVASLLKNTKKLGK